MADADADQDNPTVSFTLRCVGHWLSIRHQWPENGSGPVDHPTHPDVDHSALLDRLLSGDRPFKYPPPCVYSYPAYGLARGDPQFPSRVGFYDSVLGRSFPAEDVGRGNVVHVLGGTWRIEHSTDNGFLLSYRSDCPVRYVLLREQVDVTSHGDSEPEMIDEGWRLERDHPDPEYLPAPETDDI